MQNRTHRWRPLVRRGGSGAALVAGGCVAGLACDRWVVHWSELQYPWIVSWSIALGAACGLDAGRRRIPAIRIALFLIAGGVHQLASLGAMMGLAFAMPSALKHFASLQAASLVLATIPFLWIGVVQCNRPGDARRLPEPGVTRQPGRSSATAVP